MTNYIEATKLSELSQNAKLVVKYHKMGWRVPIIAIATNLCIGYVYEIVERYNRYEIVEE